MEKKSSTRKKWGWLILACFVLFLVIIIVRYVTAPKIKLKLWNEAVLAIEETQKIGDDASLTAKKCLVKLGLWDRYTKTLGRVTGNGVSLDMRFYNAYLKDGAETAFIDDIYLIASFRDACREAENTALYLVPAYKYSNHKDYSVSPGDVLVALVLQIYDGGIPGYISFDEIKKMDTTVGFYAENPDAVPQSRTEVYMESVDDPSSIWKYDRIEVPTTDTYTVDYYGDFAIEIHKYSRYSDGRLGWSGGIFYDEPARWVPYTETSLYYKGTKLPYYYLNEYLFDVSNANSEMNVITLAGTDISLAKYDTNSGALIWCVEIY